MHFTQMLIHVLNLCQCVCVCVMVAERGGGDT